MVDDDTAGIGKANKDVEMETDETDCQIPPSLLGCSKSNRDFAALSY